MITLRVEDRGHGIAMRHTAQPEDEIQSLGVGIPGMRARVRQLGGHLEIVSDAHGTIVTATIPLGEERSYGPYPPG